MKITVLIPHWKNGKATAHAVSKVLEHAGTHEVKIIVIDNSTGDDSIDHVLLTNLRHHCLVLHYPPGALQSHGIAFDWVLEAGHVDTEYFITMESDSYPTSTKWLDFYADLIKTDHPAIAGSLLMLSGGQYIHPCGALYSMLAWQAAKEYCDHLKRNYYYFPNLIVKEGFPCHAMVRKMSTSVATVLDMFLESTKLEVSKAYLNLTNDQIAKKAEDYLPSTGPFHCGMGAFNESIKTYGERNLVTGTEDILAQDPSKYDDVILRIGYEPGQMLSYYLLAAGSRVVNMDTLTKWIPGREGRNQQFTRMENDFVHLWGISSFYKATAGAEDPDLAKVIDFKNQQMEDLYNQLPSAHKL